MEGEKSTPYTKQKHKADMLVDEKLPSHILKKGGILYTSIPNT